MLYSLNLLHNKLSCCAFIYAFWCVIMKIVHNDIFLFLEFVYVYHVDYNICDDEFLYFFSYIV